MHSIDRHSSVRPASVHRLLLPLCVMGAMLGAGALGNLLMTWEHLTTDMHQAATAFMERMNEPPEAPADTRWWTAYPVEGPSTRYARSGWAGTPSGNPVVQAMQPGS